MNSPESLLDAVETDPLYNELARRSSEGATTLAKSRLHALTELLLRIHPRVDSCLAVRGSLVKGDTSPHSDVDLLLIGNSLEPTFARALAQAIRIKLGVSVSVQQHDVVSTIKPRLSLLLALPVLSPIGPPLSMFSDFVSASVRTLKAQSVEVLVSLWNSDEMLHDCLANPTDGDRWSVKRGRGGALTIEFCRLLSLWAAVQNPIRSQGLRLADIERYARYQRTLKLELHRQTSSSVEDLDRDTR